MDKQKISFPQYRRYLNGKNYFRIDSLESFEEIRSLGQEWLIEKYQTRILPDHHLVNDLLYNYKGFAEEISPETYELLRNRAK
ncbi:MAG TPA: hypothetical protein VFJ43_00440 [Bacteroidia bacterium]|nr:hypothetical protein [Bacteroidia bacterium]